MIGRFALCTLLLALAAGCTPKPEEPVVLATITIVPELAARLARANDLDAEEVTVTRTTFKRPGLQVEFHQIPPGGRYRPAILSRRDEWLSLTLPGGDITRFFQLPEWPRLIRSPGSDTPFIVRLEPGIEGGKELRLENWNMRDLKALPPELEVAILDLATPAGGVFDWNALENFPYLKVLRLRGVKEFRNGVELSERTLSLVLDDCANFILPTGITPEIFSASRLKLDPAILETMPAHKLSHLKLESCDLSRPPALNHFRNCLSIEIDDCPVFTSLAPLAGLPKLDTLSVTRSPIVDISALRSCPALRLVRLSNTKVEDLTPLQGIKLFMLELPGTPAARKPYPPGLDGIEVIVPVNE